MQFNKVVSQLTFLRDAPPVFVAHMLQSMRPACLEAGEFLFYEKEVGSHLFFVLMGCLELYVHVEVEFDENESESESGALLAVAAAAASGAVVLVLLFESE